MSLSMTHLRGRFSEIAGICLIGLLLPYVSAFGQERSQPRVETEPLIISSRYLENDVRLLSGLYWHQGYHFLVAIASLPETKGWIDTTLLGREQMYAGKFWGSMSRPAVDSLFRRVLTRLQRSGTPGLDPKLISRLLSFCILDRSFEMYFILKERNGDRRPLHIGYREDIQCLLSIPMAKPIVEQFLADRRIDLENIPSGTISRIQRKLVTELSSISDKEQMQFLSLLYACSCTTC
jgi:hypothetical protein